MYDVDFLAFYFVSCSEKVFDVMQNGMDSLGEDDRNAYVSDFKGFVTYVRDKGFQVYADRVRFALGPLCCSPTLALVAHDASPALLYRLSRSVAVLGGTRRLYCCSPGARPLYLTLAS